MEFNERDTLDTPSRGYPVYKLLRAVNRQYPNNGFINYVDVREDMYDSMEGQLIDEDLRDLINETLQETYINIAQDEVYSFPTVPGQREYSLPENCDLRDIQEVTRTFGNFRCPPPPPPPHDKDMAWLIFDSNGGEGSMNPIMIKIGDTITMPECEFTPPEGKVFDKWQDGEGNTYDVGDDYTVEGDVTFTAVWKDEEPGAIYTFTLTNAVDDDLYVTIESLSVTDVPSNTDLYYGESVAFVTGDDGTLGSNYQYIRAYFQGTLLVDYDMTTVLTENVIVNVTHPVVPPNPETPGDNDDNNDATPVVTPDPETPGDNEDDSSIDDPVDPIDNGNGGYEDNPLGGD